MTCEPEFTATILAWSNGLLVGALAITLLQFLKRMGDRK